MASKNSIRSMDLTQGTIWKQVILFALPLLGSSLIQQLYNTVDLIFVGQYLNKEASVAVGSGSLLITCIINFFAGLSVGISVITGQSFGAGNKEGLRKTIQTAVVICLVGGTVLAVIGVGGAPIFLRWLNTPNEVLPLAITYIRIYFISIFSIVSFNVGAGILRATGDSATPMRCQLAGGITNVVADWFFIAVLNMGVAGVAIATLASQSMAAFLTVSRLRKFPEEYRLRLNSIHADPEILNLVFTIGVPSGIQGMILTLSNLVVQGNINTLDVNSIAAFVAYYKVELFIYTPIQAIGNTAMTFVSQNVGAKQPGRARKGIRWCIGIGVALSVCTAILLLNIPSAAFSLFTRDPDVITIGTAIIHSTFPFYFVYVFLEVFSCTLRGTGRSMPPMMITIANMCGVRILLITLVMHFAPTAPMVAMIYPATWLTSACCMFVYYNVSGCLKDRSRISACIHQPVW